MYGNIVDFKNKMNNLLVNLSLNTPR